MQTLGLGIGRAPHRMFFPCLVAVGSRQGVGMGRIVGRRVRVDVSAVGIASPGPAPMRAQVDAECCYQGHQPLTTFAFRVHAHTLGRSITMTRELWNHTGKAGWHS